MTIDEVVRPETHTTWLFAILTATCDLAKVRTLVAKSGVVALAIEDTLDLKVVQKDGALHAEAIDGSEEFIGTLTVSPEGNAVASRHKHDLAMLMNNKGAVLDLSRDAVGDQRARAAIWLCAALAKAGSNLLSDVRSVRRALVTMRIEHEETLERFALLEASTANFVTPQRVEKLHLHATAAIVDLAPSKQGERVRVRQVMPIQALGLGAIELFLDGIARDAQGTVTIDLLLGSNKTPVHRWVLDATHLVNGRNVFILDQALKSRERDPVIDISWIGTNPLTIRLSSPNPIFDFCAVLDGSHLLPAPLALRCWGAVPGSRLVYDHRPAYHVGQHRQAGDAPAEPISFALSSNQLEEVTLAHPTGLSLGWSIVDYRNAHLDILVHPLNDSITVAIIRDINVRGLKQLTALVYVDNKDARAVEFSLGAIPHKSRLDRPEDLPKRWTTVGAQVYSEITGTIEIDDGSENFSLYLATRMLDNADSSLAWAFFKRIEVTV